MTRNETLILTIFDRANRLGQPSPSNNSICDVFGFASSSSASALVAGLAEAGMIEVVHHNRRSRSITLTDDGRAWLNSQPAMHAPVAPNAKPGNAGGRVGSAPPPTTTVGDTEQAKARKEAGYSNDRFLAALRRVTVPVEPPPPREGRLFLLPPPALSAEANS